MKRNIFVFEDGKFDVALMINYIEDKICLFALNECRYLCHEKQNPAEKRTFIISDKIYQNDEFQNSVIVLTDSDNINVIFRGLKFQFPNAKIKKFKRASRFKRLF